MDAPVNLVAPYDALAHVYDRWTADAGHGRWAAFIDQRLRASPRPITTVLDVCCGTGIMTGLLRDLGYRMTGVDQSEPMLRLARRRLGPDTELRIGRFPGYTSLVAFDAAVCVFDSVNYFGDASGLAASFRTIGSALRPGALFIFDLNTRFKLEKVFGSSHYGDDLDDFAYVWRNRPHAETRSVEFLISLFTLNREGTFDRWQERHVQHWYDHTEVRSAAHEAGFTVVSVTEDYTDTPVTEESLRETWVLERTDVT